MAVVGSTIMIDFHLTEDADLDSVRGAVRQNERVDPTLSDHVERAVRTTASNALDGHEIRDYTLSADVELVTERVPGAPRERITVAMDFEGDDSVIAAIDEAVTPPDRAQIADAVEEDVIEHLREYDLAAIVDTTVSITPIQFR